MEKNRKVAAMAGTVETKKILFFITTNLVVLYSYGQSLMIDPRDGRTYRTVEIGNKVWMAENLDYGDRATTRACYEDRDFFCEKFGGLYDWSHAMRACPSGWHLPTKDEYDELLISVGDKPKSRYAALVQGGNSHLDLRLGGWLYWNTYLKFRGIEQVGFYWTATESKRNGQAYRLGLPLIKVAKVFRGGKRDFVSVRCVKD